MQDLMKDLETQIEDEECNFIKKLDEEYNIVKKYDEKFKQIETDLNLILKIEKGYIISGGVVVEYETYKTKILRNLTRETRWSTLDWVENLYSRILADFEKSLKEILTLEYINVEHFYSSNILKISEKLNSSFDKLVLLEKFYNEKRKDDDDSYYK